jgi:hypothetical protein
MQPLIDPQGTRVFLLLKLKRALHSPLVHSNACTALAMCAHILKILVRIVASAPERANREGGRAAGEQR